MLADERGARFSHPLMGRPSSAGKMESIPDGDLGLSFEKSGRVAD